jgi:hypothetical protein
MLERILVAHLAVAGDKKEQARPDGISGRAALTDAGVDGGARADHNFIRSEAILRWEGWFLIVRAALASA